MITMRRNPVFLSTLLAAVLILCAANAGSAGEVAPAKAYGKICFTVVTQGNDGTKEAPFGPESKPGPGESLLAHAIASDPCVLLIAGFDRASEGLANGWRPQIAEMMTAWEEIAFPSPGWSWQTGSAEVDLYAVFIPPGSGDVAGLKQLVGAMQRPDADPDLLQSQADKLRELITALCGDTDPARHHATVAPVAVNGVVRGGEGFPWRSFAARVNLTGGHPGLVIFSSGPAADAQGAKQK